MRLAPLVKGLLLLGLAISLAGALATHDGVGDLEWVVGVAGVVALGAGAAHFSRQSFRAT